jgi:hypothetical protein
LQRFAAEPVFHTWYTGSVKSFQLVALEELQPGTFTAVCTFLKQQLPDTYCTLKQVSLQDYQCQFLKRAGQSSYRYVLFTGPAIEAALPQQQLVGRYLLTDQFEPFARVFQQHRTILDGLTSPYWPAAWAEQWLLFSPTERSCSNDLMLSGHAELLQLTGMDCCIKFYYEPGSTCLVSSNTTLTARSPRRS